MISPEAAFERQRDQIIPEITELFDDWPELVEIYASVDLLHNTHSSLVPKIIEEGLNGDSSSITEEDLVLARNLLRTRGKPGVSGMFDIYVNGTRNGRERGVFFYTPGMFGDRYDIGYGVPERAWILAQEMRYVALNEGFSTNDRNQAQAITDRFHEAYLTPDASITVLKADPFAPEIINNRLSDAVGRLREAGKDCTIFALPSVIQGGFQGLYIPGTVSPEHLTVETTIPLDQDEWRKRLSAPTTSRYFE